MLCYITVDDSYRIKPYSSLLKECVVPCAIGSMRE
jgi:hypothetical protein